MNKILVLSGAGISATAKIPTFDDVPEMREVLSLEYFTKHYEEFWEKLIPLYKRIVDARPTLAHKLISSNYYDIITMNIDGLHTKAGSTNVIEVHGNLQNVHCTNSECNSVFKFEDVYNLRKCPKCSSKLKPGIVLYGEEALLYQKAFDTLFKYAGKDFLIVGTSFKNEFPIKMKEQAEKLHCNIKIINKNADEEVADYLIDYLCK